MLRAHFPCARDILNRSLRPELMSKGTRFFVAKLRLAFLCLWLFTSASFALSTNEMLPFISRTWEADSGLPHNSVLSVLQTRDGYLWLGTQLGLARFDGARFTTFDPLKGEGVRCLYQTRDGTLWIGGEKKGLVRFKDGEFVLSPVPANAPVKTMLEDSKHVLWIGTTNGLARYENGLCTWFTSSNGLPSSVVLALCEDGEDNLWIGTTDGLIRYKTGFQETFNDQNGLPDNSIRTLGCDRKGYLWIGTGGGGIVRLHNGKFNRFSTKEGLPDNFITAIFADSRGELWVGTMGGLCRWFGNRFVQEYNNGVTFEAVYSLAEDSEGSIWTGTKEGLNQLRVKAFNSYTTQQGIPHNNVMAVYEDRHGTIWTPTWGGGLCGLKDGTISIFNSTNSPLPSVLLSVHETRDGSLWIGSDYGFGLFQYKDETFTAYKQKDGFVDSAVRVICEDKAGHLWLGTSAGLYLRRDRAFRRFTTEDGIAGNTIRAIYEDRDGNLWIGTNDGLTRRSNGHFTSFTSKDGLPANEVTSIFEDEEHCLWIGTDGGLCRTTNAGDSDLEIRNSKFTSYTSKDGLFSDNILEVVEDHRGYLWMSCFSGVFCVKKKDLDDFDLGRIQKVPCASYGKSDGMSSAKCNGVSKPASWRSNDGRLWFATIRGVVVVDPGLIRENDTPPLVVVEDIIADKKKLSPSHDLTISPGKGDLEFNYTALSFQTPEKNRFKYKLEGVDPEWVEAGARRVAYYNNIAPGKYVFHVSGSNNKGIWNESGARVEFILLPHFWQTWWFKSLAVFAGLSFAAAGARYVTRKRMALRIAQVEQQYAVERERARIAKDIHDDLGASLTRITFLGELAETDLTKPESVENYVHRIVTTARDTVRSLDEIVWAVTPRRDTLNSLVEYVAHYANEFLEKTDVRCRLDLPESVPEIALSSEVRHSLFLVVKEFLNNSVKHAQATEIFISMKFRDAKLAVEIRDNGRGFDPSQLAKGQGNGLENMRKRIEQLGGASELESSPEQGTRLWFEVRLAQLMSVKR